MDETAPLLPSSRPPSTPDNESHDPSDPQSWPQWYKWSLTALLAFISFTVTFTCISLVPIANHIVADLDSRNPPRLDGNTGSTSSSGVLLVTIWELGEAAGPLLIAPLSEIYGRAMVFNVTNVLFILTTALGAVSDSTGLLIFARFLTGTAVASNVLNPAVIGDIFPPSQRGTAMSMVMLTPLVGGAVGPAVAGAIAQEAGWRRVLWMSVGLATAAEVLFMLGFRETYSGALLKKKARAGLDMKSAELEAVNEGKSLVWEGIKRPVTIFCSSFILQILSLYGSVVFSFFYVVSTTLPGILEEEYGWAPAMVGSSFLSFSLGSLLAIITLNLFLDRLYASLQRRHQTSHPDQMPTETPEYRLPLVLLGATLLPLSVSLYGCSASLHLPAPYLLTSVVFLGFSVILAVVPVTSYVVDAFGAFSASALTAVLITRCLMGTFLPLAAGPLEASLGYGWGMLVLAGLAAILAPIPAVVMRWGGRWRERCLFTIAT